MQHHFFVFVKHIMHGKTEMHGAAKRITLKLWILVRELWSTLIQISLSISAPHHITRQIHFSNIKL